MGKSYRHEKTEQREREFPYIPTGVPVVSTGRAYEADDNQAYVRALLASRQPRFADAVKRALADVEREITLLEEAVEILRNA